MKKQCRTLNRALKKETDKLTDEFNILTSRMQPYEVTAFYTDLDSSYKYYSDKFFNEEKFSNMILKIYDVDLSDHDTKDEVYESILAYSRAKISLNTLRCFLKTNDIDLGDTE